MSENIAVLNALLVVETAEFEAALEKIKKKTEDAGKSIEDNMKQIATGFELAGSKLSNSITKPVISLGKTFIQNAVAMEDAVNKVDEVFLENAENIKNWASISIDLMGIASQTAMKTANSYGSMAKGIGFSDHRILTMSKSLTELSVDLASFNDTSQETAATALSGVFTGQISDLNKLGIVMSEVNLQQFALNDGISKSISEMTEAEKVQLRYAYIMSVTSDVQGDFARNSDSIASQLNITKEKVKEVGASFGKLLLPIVNNVLVTFNDFLDGLNDMSPTGKTVVIALTGIAAATGPVLLGMSKTISAVSTLNKTFAAIKAVKAASQLSSVATASSNIAGGLAAANIGSAGLAASLGTVAIAAVPVIAIMGLLTAAYLKVKNEQKELLEETKKNTISSEEFFNKFSEREYTIEKFGDEVEYAANKLDNLDDSIEDIDTDIEFKINTSVLDEARGLIDELNTAYGSLLLALDEGKASANEANKVVENIGNELKNTKRGILQSQIEAVLNPDDDYVNQVLLLNEINNEIDDYNVKVDTAVKSIKAYNNAMVEGKEITVETLENYYAGQAILEELGGEMNGLTNDTKTLEEQIEILNNQSIGDVDGTRGYLVLLEQLTGIFGSEMSPVIQDISKVWDEYNQKVSAAPQAADDELSRIQHQIEKNKELKETYDGLLIKVQTNDYLMADVVKKLNDPSYEPVSSDIFSEFYGSLSQLELDALSQFTSFQNLTTQIVGTIDAKATEAVELQGKLQNFNKEEFITNAQVEATKEAVTSITTSLSMFNEEGELTWSQAATMLKEYLDTSGVTLDEGILSLLSSMSSFETDLANTTSEAGGKSLDELLAPFVDNGKLLGEYGVNYFTDGIQNGIENKSEELKNDFLAMAEEEAGAYNDGLGNNSPSWKAEESSKYFIEGAVKGLDDNAYKLYEKAREIADRVSDTINKAWEIKSPSKVANRIGVNFITGLEMGINSKANNLLISVGDVGNSVAEYSKRAFNVMTSGTNLLLDNLALNALQSPINNYNNQRSITTSVNVQGGQDKLEIERIWRKLVRQQAVAIAR